MCQTNPLPYFSPVIRKNEMLAFHISPSTMQVDIFKMAGHFPAVYEVTKMDIFDKTLGHFQVMLMATKPCIFDNTQGHFPAALVATKPDISDEMSG